MSNDLSKICCDRCGEAAKFNEAGGCCEECGDNLCEKCANWRIIEDDIVCHQCAVQVNYVDSK